MSGMAEVCKMEYDLDTGGEPCVDYLQVTLQAFTQFSEIMDDMKIICTGLTICVRWGIKA